ncbi:MAG: thermonuclease family protein [Thermodesulfitimonas sp.]
MRTKGIAALLLLLALYLTAGGCRERGENASVRAGLPAQCPPAAAVTARVVRVIDGDTVVVRFQAGPAVSPDGNGYSLRVPGGWVRVGKEEKVRLIGVNAPETGAGQREAEVYGWEAKAYTRKRTLGRVVRLEFDVETRDRYGRLLAYLYLDGNLFNRELVKEGYAQVYTAPPNLKYTAAFLSAQREALEAGRGLWQKRHFVTGPVIGNSRTYTYHLPGCSGLPAPANRVYFHNEREALMSGYHPCRKCCLQRRLEGGKGT